MGSFHTCIVWPRPGPGLGRGRSRQALGFGPGPPGLILLARRLTGVIIPSGLLQNRGFLGSQTVHVRTARATAAPPLRRGATRTVAAARRRIAATTRMAAPQEWWMANLLPIIFSSSLPAAFRVPECVYKPPLTATRLSTTFGFGYLLLPLWAPPP